MFPEILCWYHVVAFCDSSKNIALKSNGASCVASSEFYNGLYPCENSINGILSVGPGNEWATNGETIGAWILIALPDLYVLSKARLMQRVHKLESFKDVDLIFSDYSKVQVISDFVLLETM